MLSLEVENWNVCVGQIKSLFKEFDLRSQVASQSLISTLV